MNMLPHPNEVFPHNHSHITDDDIERRIFSEGIGKMTMRGQVAIIDFADTPHETGASLAARAKRLARGAGWNADIVVLDTLDPATLESGGIGVEGARVSRITIAAPQLATSRVDSVIAQGLGLSDINERRARALEQDIITPQENKASAGFSWGERPDAPTET